MKTDIAEIDEDSAGRGQWVCNSCGTGTSICFE